MTELMQELFDNVFYVGVNDHELDLFEGLYKVPHGVSYNSYIIMDEKIAIMDSVDTGYGDEWIKKVEEVLNGREPDYLIVHHMEPDHSANIFYLVKKYPNVVVVGNNKTFVMLGGYFGTGFPKNRMVVCDGDKISLGRHELNFVFAPMVHWPEVMMTYESCTKTMFTADAFGKFGALDHEDNWVDEARRYYIGIVGKFGVQVQSILRKLSKFEINNICALHGNILSGDLSKYINCYDTWSSYTPETEGVLIAYTSIYGNTRSAAKALKVMLDQAGVKNELVDLTRDDNANCVALAFKYSTLVLATTTYNAEIFPTMREFIDKLNERNYQNRYVAFIENGSWAPVAAKQMRDRLSKCRNMTFSDNVVTIHSGMSPDSVIELNVLAAELTEMSVTKEA